MSRPPGGKIVVDGRTIETRDGELIIEAAERGGIVIPRFCYHERLVPIAACRLCLVEIEGVRGLQPSCATPVKDGMIVKTRTPDALASHAEVLDNVLSYHPLDCPKCERSGCCELQTFSYEFASKELPIYQPPGHPGVDYREAPWGEIIRYDPFKCVKCYRCTRACDELADVRALTIAERGFETKIAVFGDGALGCDYCGICVDVCPTGAISQWPSKFLAKDWEYAKTDTTCAHCAVGCRFVAQTWEGTIAAAKTRTDLGPNQGNLCAKGRYGYDFGSGEGRITSPLVRRGGVLAVATWEEALAAAAEGIRSSKPEEAAGRVEICGVASGDLSVEDLWNFRRLLEVVSAGGIRPEGGEADRTAWYQESLGTIGSTASLRDLDSHEAILVVGLKPPGGFDPWDEAPVLAQEIQRLVRVKNVRLHVEGNAPRLAEYASPGAPPADARIAVVFSLERTGFSDLKRILEMRASWGPGGSNLYPVGARANGRALAVLGIHPTLAPGWKPAMATRASADAKVLLLAGAEVPVGAKPRCAIATAAYLTASLERTADVVFPAATLYEKPATVINLEGRPQSHPAPALPPGDARPDAHIWAALGAALGHRLADSPDAIRAEIRAVLPGLLDPPVFSIRPSRVAPFPSEPSAPPLPPATMFTGPLADRSPWLAKVREQNDRARKQFA